MFMFDFYKSFDCVSKDFLDDIFSKFGLGSAWRLWLLMCRKTITFFVWVNGSVGKTFESSRVSCLSPLLDKLRSR